MDINSTVSPLSPKTRDQDVAMVFIVAAAAAIVEEVIHCFSCVLVAKFISTAQQVWILGSSQTAEGKRASEASSLSLSQISL
jgi:hypothetical protein